MSHIERALNESCRPVQKLESFIMRENRKKLKNTAKKKRIIIVFLAILGSIVPASLLYLYLFGGCHVSLWPYEEFEEREWRDAYEQAEAYVYVRDMIASERFIGMKREQVIGSLGPPDRNTPEWISYYVRGFERRSLIDGCLYDFGANLVFQLDDAARVSELTIFSH